MMTNQELQTAINSLVAQIDQRWKVCDIDTVNLLRGQLNKLLEEQESRAKYMMAIKDMPEFKAKLPNGALVSNVYEAYEEGLKQSGR